MSAEAKDSRGDVTIEIDPEFQGPRDHWDNIFLSVVTRGSDKGFSLRSKQVEAHRLLQRIYDAVRSATATSSPDKG